MLNQKQSQANNSLRVYKVPERRETEYIRQSASGWQKAAARRETSDLARKSARLSAAECSLCAAKDASLTAFYSWRSAFMGSIRVARTAGRLEAARATRARRAAT